MVVCLFNKSFIPWSPEDISMSEAEVMKRTEAGRKFMNDFLGYLFAALHFLGWILIFIGIVLIIGTSGQTFPSSTGIGAIVCIVIGILLLWLTGW